MGRLCVGVHEISGFKDPIFLHGWVGVVVWVGRQWVGVGWWWCGVGGVFDDGVGWVVVGVQTGGGVVIGVIRLSF